MLMMFFWWESTRPRPRVSTPDGRLDQLQRVRRLLWTFLALDVDALLLVPLTIACVMGGAKLGERRNRRLEQQMGTHTIYPA